MPRLLQSFWGLIAALFFVLSTFAAQAQDTPRNISLLPDIDLPGFDYSTIKDTTLDACSAACADDRICRAFTFNDKAKWCFLKSEAATDQTAFNGATSGTVDPNAEINNSAAREAELPFPASDLAYYARSFANDLRNTDPPPEGAVYAELVKAGDAAVEDKNPAAAILAYRQALAINNNDPAVWLKLATLAVVRSETD